MEEKNLEESIRGIKEMILDRSELYALYMLYKEATVRETAEYFGISKTWVHVNLTQRLPQYNRCLYEEVQEVLQKNKAERHIRGGEATKKLWTKERS